MLTRKMKDSGIEWIGEVPEEWETRRLKVAIKRVRELIEKYDGENILSLTMNGVIVRDLINPVGKMPTTFDGYQKIKKGNIITCLFDIDVTPRCVGIANHEGLTSPAYTQYKINEEFDTKFVFYYLLMLDNDKVIVPITKSLRNTMKNEDFLNLGFSFPNLKNQIKISEFIDENIKRINNLKKETIQSITELKKYKQSLITEAVTKGLDPNVEMKDSGIEWIGKIPKHWEVKQLKYLTQERKEQLSRNTDKDFIFNYVDIGSVTFENGIENFEKLRFQNSPSRARKIVYKNDIIVSTVRTYLRSIARIKNDNEYIVSTGFCVLIPNQNNNPTFIEFLTKADFFTNQVEMNSKGIAYPSITPDKLLSLNVIEPPLCEQNKIVSYLDEQICRLDKIIEDKTKVIEELEGYKKSLIYEYVTGKKEV